LQASLILAAVRTYGVLAGAAQRTKESVCVWPSGAVRGRVVRMILRWGFTVAVSGLAMGLVGAVALSPVLEVLLFGLTAGDPVTYVVVGATFQPSLSQPTAYHGARDEDRSASRIPQRLE
jgi:putative ABC transport system permease protein